jgi:hypothetical protein
MLRLPCKLNFHAQKYQISVRKLKKAIPFFKSSLMTQKVEQRMVKPADWNLNRRQKHEKIYEKKHFPTYFLFNYIHPASFAINFWWWHLNKKLSHRANGKKKKRKIFWCIHKFREHNKLFWYIVEDEKNTIMQKMVWKRRERVREKAEKFFFPVPP